MKRQLLTLALAGVFGLLATVDASACCHKKAACPAPATCVVAEPCPPPPPPVCEPAPVCAPAPKKCGLFSHMKGKKMFGGLCHKKAATCAPAPVACETYAPAPTAYYPVPSPQASHQGY